MPEPDYKALLFQLCASLTLCDHMGDVAEDIFDVLKMAGLEKAEEETGTEDWMDLVLKTLPPGTTTIYGTTLRDDDD